MPYIKNQYNVNSNASSPGELNYEFTQIINQYINKHKLSYSIINDILGALEGCKLEFYRRIAAPYEDKKAILNGDVYES